MVLPVHIGFEHPNLFWIVGVGVLAFVTGLCINLYRSSSIGRSQSEIVASEEET